MLLNEYLNIYPVFHEFNLYDGNNRIEFIQNAYCVDIKRDNYTIQTLIKNYPIFEFIGKCNFYLYNPINAELTYHSNIIELLLYINKLKGVK